MKCPICLSPDTTVIDSRPTEDSTRRRRKCLSCGERWTTWEHEQKPDKDGTTPHTEKFIREAWLERSWNTARISKHLKRTGRDIEEHEVYRVIRQHYNDCYERETNAE